jgi:outer membrane protein assembly factor BamB
MVMSNIIKYLLPILVLMAMLTAMVRGDDWPQWMGPKGDGVWREDGILSKFPAGGPPVKWRVKIGSGYSGPSVAKDSVYVIDRIKTDPAKPCERILCLEADTGRVLWEYSYPCTYGNMGYGSGPRSSPAVDGNKVYSLGAMGDLLCLDSVTGKLLWQKNLPQQYDQKVPTWGFSTQLLVNGARLFCIVGGSGHAVVALDKDTGKELWRALSSSEPGYSAPILREINGKLVLVVWHADGLAGLEPETGVVLWSVVYPSKMGMNICTPAVSGDRICVSGQWEGSAMFRILPGKTEPALLWHFNNGISPEKPFKASGMHDVIGTILFMGDQVYGVSMYGEFCGLDATTGRRLWTSMDAAGVPEPKDKWFTAFIVPQGQRCFVFTDQGDLIIAYLSSSGYESVARTHLLDPDMPVGNRKVIWSHPAFARRCIYVRTDSELVCFSLAATD